MADKTTTLVLFTYSDGSSEYAVGDHAQEVMTWLNGCQTMSFIHGGEYKGRRMIEVPAPTSDLESVASIAERTFLQEVAELVQKAKEQ